MFYKFSSIILNSKKNRSTNEVFICQPDIDKERLAGKMFILIEITSKKKSALTVLNFLIDNLDNNYYQDEKIILSEKISSLKVEHIFESTLAKTNKDFNAFLFSKKIKISLDDINITVGIAHKNELHFSQSGKNKAFMICRQQEKQKHAKPVLKYIDKNKKLQYQMVNIEQNDEQHAQKNQEKLFSNIISGIIPASGYILFSNEALPEYLSNKQLIEIITNLPPVGSAEHIKNILSQINSYASFLGVIIKNNIGLPQEKNYEQNKKIGKTTQNSISKLNSTEEQTEKLLVSHGIINFKKNIKSIFFLLSKILLKIKNSNKSISRIKQNKNVLQKKQLFLIIKQIIFRINHIRKQASNGVKIIMVYTINLFRSIVKIFSNKESHKQFLRNIKPFFQKFVEKIINKFKKITRAIIMLNVKSKILFLIFVVCLILLITNISFVNEQNKNSEQQQNFELLIKRIEKKQNQIDANLLYKNEEDAKKILNELKEIFKTTAKFSEEQLKIYQTILQKHDEQLKIVRHITKIDKQIELINFKNFNDNPEILNIILIDNKIYCKDSGQTTIYIFDLLSNALTTNFDLEKQHKEFKYPIIDKNQNVYYFNFTNNRAIQFNAKTKKLSTLDVNFPQDAEIAATASFNNMLYLLDKHNNQIYRSSKNNNGFTKQEEWLKEKTDFSNAVDLSIDGNIYVLKENCEILKYLKGKKQEFILDSIDPLFTKASKIVASPKLNFIYILESVSNRLAVFNKSGKFLTQYQSDKFINLKDFIVDEDKNKIYFLDENSIYEASATHLE
ncbi:MAG: hypothetical protein ABII99_01495 [Patescibacteria group bacterium]|nr:hypothetical protein [Patescibacteria group bacterium]